MRRKGKPTQSKKPKTIQEQKHTKIQKQNGNQISSKNQSKIYIQQIKNKPQNTNFIWAKKQYSEKNEENSFKTPEKSVLGFECRRTQPIVEKEMREMLDEN